MNKKLLEKTLNVDLNFKTIKIPKWQTKNFKTVPKSPTLQIQRWTSTNPWNSRAVLKNQVKIEVKLSLPLLIHHKLAALFRGYGIEENNSIYYTSNGEYGKIPPSVHTVPLR